MTERHSDHLAHDSILIASLAEADPSDSNPARARDQVEACPDCAALQADLLALAAATHALPATQRPRDFRLTAADAERLQRRGWRSILHRLAGPRFAIAQPLGAVLATLGLAGFLLVSAPALQPNAVTSERLSGAGAPSSAGGDRDAQSQGGKMPDQAPYPTVVDQGGPASGPGSGGQEAFDAAGTGDGPPRSPDATLVILSGSFGIAGLGLLGLRWTARRIDGS
jgi:hypothetical protein